MACKKCGTEEPPGIFPSTIQLHLDASRRVTPVTLKPVVRVCFACGFAAFDIPDRELEVLKEGAGEGVRV